MHLEMCTEKHAPSQSKVHTEECALPGLHHSKWNMPVAAHAPDTRVLMCVFHTLDMHSAHILCTPVLACARTHVGRTTHVESTGIASDTHTTVPTKVHVLGAPCMFKSPLAL